MKEEHTIENNEEDNAQEVLEYHVIQIGRRLETFLLCINMSHQHINYLTFFYFLKYIYTYMHLDTFLGRGDYPPSNVPS